MPKKPCAKTNRIVVPKGTVLTTKTCYILGTISHLKFVIVRPEAGTRRMHFHLRFSDNRFCTIPAPSLGAVVAAGRGDGASSVVAVSVCTSKLSKIQ